VREYSVAAAVILGGATVAATRTGVLRRQAAWTGLGAFATLTVAADNLLIAARVYGYSRRHRSGIEVGRMPLEDLAYGIALYLVALSAWDRADAAR
jgi:lycopene cyclase domain-containing protein